MLMYLSEIISEVTLKTISMRSNILSSRKNLCWLDALSELIPGGCAKKRRVHRGSVLEGFLDSLQMLADFFEVHDVRVLVVHVKQVDLVREETAIKAAFFHDHGMESVRVRVNDAGPNTATSTFSANEEAIRAMTGQVGDQRRPEKRAGPLFVDYQVGGFWMKFFQDLGGVPIDSLHLTFGRSDPCGIERLGRLIGRIDDRDPLGSGHGQQLLDRFHGVPCVDST